jgi:hypothetical protein
MGRSVGMWESELARSLPERQIWFRLDPLGNIRLLWRLRSAPAAPPANLAPVGEPPASSAPLVNSAPLANLALSAQWLDKRRAHEQQKQTTTRTTMNDRLTYFGVDDAMREKRKSHNGRPIIMKEGGGGRNNKK